MVGKLRFTSISSIVFIIVSQILVNMVLFRYLQTLSSRRTDRHLHRRIGEFFNSQGDRSGALQYYFDVDLMIFKLLI